MGKIPVMVARHEGRSPVLPDGLRRSYGKMCHDGCGGRAAKVELLRHRGRFGEFFDVARCGFGIFIVKQHNARIGHNPRTGEVVAVGEKTRQFFKAGKEMLGRLNRGSKPPSEHPT